MKLQMEFEDEDFREMIFEFFSRQNFVLHNLDELCEQFKQVFPNGLKASVAVKLREAPVAATPISIPQDPVMPTALPVENPLVVPPKTASISKEDLLDPTQERSAPSAEELKEEDISAYAAVGEVPLDAVLKQSRDLEQDVESNV